MPSKVQSLYDDAEASEWLVRLRSYRNRPNRSAEEDFLTTAVAWTCSSHADVRSRVLRAIFPDVTIEDECRIQTQRVNDVGDRPDLRFEACRFVGLVECKVGSHPNVGQLRRYWDQLLLEAMGREIRLTYLGVRLPELPVEFRGRVHLCQWTEVYLAIKSSMEAELPLVRGLLGLMETMGLIPVNPIRADFGATVEAFREQKASLEQLVNRVCEQFETHWQKETGKLPVKISDEPCNGINPRERYFGRKYDLLGDETKFGVYLIWYDNTQHSLALYMQPPNSEIARQLYASMLRTGWIERWESDWPGATLRIPVCDIASDFYSRHLDEQAEKLAYRTIVEFRTIASQRSTKTATDSM